MEKGDWKLIYTCSTELEAHHIKNNLEGAEIPCQILSQVDSTRMFTLGELAIVKLFVPEENYNDAKEILKDIQSNSGD